MEDIAVFYNQEMNSPIPNAAHWNLQNKKNNTSPNNPKNIIFASMQHQDRYQQLLDATELERAQEESFYRSLAANKTLKEKADAGILWYPVNITKKHFTIGEYIEIVVQRTKESAGRHQFRVGAGCVVFYSEKERVEYSGTVSFMQRDKMGVILRSDFIQKDQLIDKGNVGVELVYDERPYKVMKAAVKAVMQSKDPIVQALREGIRKKEAMDLELNENETPPLPQNSMLNDTQTEAVKGSLSAAQMSIIHGPPGTGKTTTLVTLVQALSKVEKRIFVCAPSNNAVDLLARQLDDLGIPVLRIGNVTRIGDSIAHLTIAEKARNHPDWKHIKKVKLMAEEAKRQAMSYKRNFGAQQRRERTDMHKEARELRKWARELGDRLTADIINESRVIATTLVGISAPALEGVNCNTLVIDEASQTLEAECWNAMLRARRVILAGDHFQLPPTIKSLEAKNMGLDHTLLERMAGSIKHSYLLREQYRMNDQILGFSNARFYDGKLYSNTNVANHKLEGDEHPVTFIDTSGCAFDEALNKKQRSLSNPGEYFILKEHMHVHFEDKETGKYPGLADVSIGIISPYAEQVRFIRSEMRKDLNLMELDVVVDSIDGFQGQEKDVIYISLVRSNEKGIVGFLKDYRRLNVAMTRARKKLVIIGDMTTLSSEPLFNELADYIEQNGLYQSAWEYMG
jgi:superfamily I DNA and/or RNA helicase